jgi:hypothetical protein
MGNTFVPTEDGKGWTVGGEAKPLNKKSNAGKQAEKLEDGGFPMDKLVTSDGKPDVSGLVGGAFELDFVPRLNRDGEKKTWVDRDGNTRDELITYLGTFVGFRGAPPAQKVVSEEDISAAREIVAKVIKDAGGAITQPALIRALTAAKADKQIITLLLKKSFNEGAPWSKDGATYNLVPF